MKGYNKKETIAYVIAGIIAAALFMILLFALKMNYFAALAIAAAAYVGFSLIFRPEKKPAEINSERSMELMRRLDAAQRGFRKIEDTMTEISDSSVRAEAESLHAISAKIVDYLSAHPERIDSAREFIDYYQKTAAKLLTRYAELEAAELNTDEAERQKSDTFEALKTLNCVFSRQFEKLMSSDMTDTDAEIRLLKQTVKLEGIE